MEKYAQSIYRHEPYNNNNKKTNLMHNTYLQFFAYQFSVTILKKPVCKFKQTKLTI